MLLKDHAEAIGNELGLIEFIPVILTLLPMLLKCFAGESTASPREYLEDQYDGTQYDSHLINRTRHQTRRAARQNGQTGLSRDELDQITVATFDHAREQSDMDVASCMAEAATIQE